MIEPVTNEPLGQKGSKEKRMGTTLKRLLKLELVESIVTMAVLIILLVASVAMPISRERAVFASWAIGFLMGWKACFTWAELKCQKTNLLPL